MIAHTTTAPHRQRRTVLIADDEEPIRMVIARVLKTLGFETVTVEDGIAAVEAANLHRDALLCIIMDVHMPRRDGIEVAHDIRQYALNLPIILMTGASASSLFEQLGNLPSIHILEKPFSFSTLNTLVLHLAEQVAE